MNQKDSRWIAFLVWRVASYALLGGFCTALFGAICIGIAGAATGVVIDNWRLLSYSQSSLLGLIVGLVLGGGGAAIAGFLIFGVTGFRSAQRPSFLPPHSLLRSVALGQILSTFAVCSSFSALELTISLVKNRPFHELVNEHLFWIMFGAPAVMVCGAIAGAMWGFRREKAHVFTDKIENIPYLPLIMAPDNIIVQTSASQKAMLFPTRLHATSRMQPAMVQLKP
ncbi:MAG TPA: hypothetical protein VGB45_13750 [Abditibacterium sp.]|jgi:hypothetical protein